MSESFGQRFKRLRLASGQTLRAFCLRASFDPGNVSKIERGRMAPPESDEVLSGYAAALGLTPNTEEWMAFMDHAAAERGRVPTDLMSDKDLVNKLPILFRSMREAGAPRAESLRELAEEIRRL